MVEDDERLIILLNLGEILSASERIALGEVLKQANGEAKKKRDPAAKAPKSKKRGGRRKNKEES